MHASLRSLQANSLDLAAGPLNDIVPFVRGYRSSYGADRFLTFYQMKSIVSCKKKNVTAAKSKALK